MAINEMLDRVPPELMQKAKIYKEKIAGWSSPVEFVNNMYGCHPGQNGEDYFTAIYK